MNPIHFLRMARWARRPPSLRRVILVVSVIAICLVLAGLEWLDVLPDWLGLEPQRRQPKIKTIP